MPVFPAPVRHRRQRSGIAALRRDLPDHVDPLARLAPDMGEAKEVERGAVRNRMVGALRPLEAEVDEARLVGMKREPIPGKTLVQNRLLEPSQNREPYAGFGAPTPGKVAGVSARGSG